MYVEHHDLQYEFPEMTDVISVLRRENPMFSRLYASYSYLTDKVENLERHDMPISDFTFQDMKKQRVKLKDDLYYLMVAYRMGQRDARR